MAPGEQILPEDLPVSLREKYPLGESSESWQDALHNWTRKALYRGQIGLMAEARVKLEKIMFDCTLDYTGGKRVEAARLLGLGRNTLTRKLKELEDN
jgi:two-component system nitrogen regulation response regulator GlnG